MEAILRNSFKFNGDNNDMPKDSPSIKYNGNGNGNIFRKNIIGIPPFNNGFLNGNSANKPSAWDDSTDTATNASSGTSTCSVDEEFADAESQTKFNCSESSTPLSLKVKIMESLISSMFLTVSSLKDAYMKVQAAHDPYDPAKLQQADMAMITELKKFSELKHSYRSRVSILNSPENDSLDGKENAVASYERIIQSLQSEIQAKDATVRSLNDKLSASKIKKEKLERRVKRLEQKLANNSVGNMVNVDATPSTQLLESSVLGASEASKEFSKLLISLMKTAQWDLEAAANSIEPGISYLRATHKKFVFESYVSHRMLSGFERVDFGLNGENGPEPGSTESSCDKCFKEFLELRAMDPVAVVTSKPESSFAKFCLKKYLELIHPKMEESFFGNLEHRKQISNGFQPRSQFYHSFLKLARSMWMLHKMAFSLQPSASIFEAKRDMDFSPLCMESIVQLVEIDMRTRPKVGFTVMPGFRVDNTIIKCQVYIAVTKS